MGLEIEIDRAAKKALVTFTHEIDMAHALRTEKLQVFDVMTIDSSGNRVLYRRFSTLSEAQRAARLFAESMVVEVDLGERHCVEEKEQIAHAVREAGLAFTAAITAHSMSDAVIEKALAAKTAELEAHRAKRPTVTIK